MIQDNVDILDFLKKISDNHMEERMYIPSVEAMDCFKKYDREMNSMKEEAKHRYPVYIDVN